MRKSVFTEKFKLDGEQEKRVREEIKAFYLDAFDEEIGMIKEQQILDLFYENLAPVIYNKVWTMCTVGTDSRRRILNRITICCIVTSDIRVGLMLGRLQQGC